MDTSPVAHRPVPRRLQKMVESAEAQNLITEEGFQAFLNLCNPFPDSDVVGAGWPGIHPVKTIPNAVTLTENLSAPAGTTTSWNFHAVMLPYIESDYSMIGCLYNNITGAVTGGTVSTDASAMFQYWTWKDADPVPNFQTDAPTGYLSPANFVVSNAEQRLCAGGIEAINTSALIDRSGYGYAYRTQGDVDSVSFITSVAPATSLLQRNVAIMSPPLTFNQIVNYSTTYQGTAERGIVCVNLPNKIENPFAPAVTTRLACIDRSSARATIMSSTPHPVFDWATAGIIVTGLKPEASFQLKCRAFFEAAPLPGGGYTQTLARSSVPYSPMMLELVANTLASMPAGFDYAENPFGEWMSKVLNLASHAFPAIGKALPLPYAASIGSALGNLAGAGSKALSPAKNAKKTATPKAKKATSSQSQPNVPKQRKSPPNK